MSFATAYINKQKNFRLKVLDKPHPNLKYIVVIPCYYEFELIKTLTSLWNSKRISAAVEVIIVINSSENTELEIVEQNRKTYIEVKNWTAGHDDSMLRFFVINEENLPKKFAGAGLARKIGMDQALCRFNQINQDKGIIISLDADTVIKKNYFTELEKHFTRYPKTNVATIYFEHPVNGSEFSADTYEAISIYELYLRYYKLALDYCGFPYARYTVGSCFAVNAQAYAKQGGMNRKQAGEDFYFLHKIFPLGNSHEINTTCVYPSSRPSNRVPFGTGPMVQAISEKIKEEFLTYNFNAFGELRYFFNEVKNLFGVSEEDLQTILNRLPESVSDYLTRNDFEMAIVEINQNSSSIDTFTKRFYNWFDAFRILKYLNFSHEKYFNKASLIVESRKLYQKITDKNLPEANPKEMLEEYRKLERNL